MQKVILTTESAKHFSLSSARMNIGRFPGGEVSLAIKEGLSGAEVFVVGSINAPAENLLEMVFAIDTAARLGAKKVTAVIPYFAYLRADREKFPGDSVSAGTIIKMLEAVGGPNFNIVSLNIHSPRAKEFFKVPFSDVDAEVLFEEKFIGLKDITIVGPDEGAGSRARDFARKIGINNIAILDKERAEDGSVKISGILGAVGKKVLIIDDIIDSGATLLKASEFLKEKGVNEIYIAAVHTVWRGEGFQKLAESDLVKKIYTTDTIAPPDNVPEKIEIISIAPILQKIFS